MTVTNLFDRQVDSLVSAVRRLDRSGGKDESAKESVRKQVAGELMNQGQLKVVAAAMGELAGDSGIKVLDQMVMHCRETFYLEDRTLSAVVVPVAVRIKSTMDGDVQIAEAQPEEMASLATIVKRITGARHVAFDTRVYEAKALYYSKANELAEFLKKLEAGERRPEGGPQTTTIRSCAEPGYRMVYFLGVEVSEPGAPLVLNSDTAQRMLMEYRCHAEWALAESGMILFNNRITADAQCVGFWYLNRGVAEGEDHIRGYQLYAHLNNFDQGVGGVRFRYALDETNSQIRLLITSDLMTIEYRWDLFAEEGMEGFLRELDVAIARLVPEDDVLVKEELHLYDYEKVAKQAGLVWL